MKLKSTVAALVVAAGPAFAQNDAMNGLFDALQTAEMPEARQIVDKIGEEWSRSGSPAMDLLLDRGRDALSDGDTAAALTHLGALVDHAPDFAEGYNARATAHFSEGRYGQALDDIRMALDLNPRHFGAMTGLGFILEEVGEDAQALAVWQEVLRLYPASPQAAQAMPRLQRAVEGRAL